ncbi:phage tail protein [Vibrio parahaemolyticus]|uniref:phage tail-collar fiber domain-containing protein n=2 Tax=Vibrio TaxID=662 RepID=UPI002B20403C|nr:phage tail protein [Vibrio parahaemolyticus]MEA5369915.1 phage tail protein [Vibrio parahaemolyticus]
MANTTDKSILTAAGKALLAQLNAEEKPLIIDKMIFANVPNRPEFPQPDDVVPTDHVVHQEGVEQRGRLSADSVIYSTTLTSDVGPFEFNWTGAYCSEYGVLVTIDHHALTPKSADEPGVAGNTLVRSVVLEYKDIAEITNITVDASSWQYNATPRMKKMDDDVAQAIIDQNGKDWFIEGGFLVTPQASTFNIKAGAGYVSGNRVTLEFDRNVQVPNKPSFIYVDAHREGTPTGEQVTLFDFVVTSDEKDDYTDANGVKHLVCKIAQVLGDGSVSDLRPKNKTLEEVGELDTDRQQSMTGRQVVVENTGLYGNYGQLITDEQFLFVITKGEDSILYRMSPQPDSLSTIKNLDVENSRVYFDDNSSSDIFAVGRKEFRALERGFVTYAEWGVDLSGRTVANKEINSAHDFAKRHGLKTKQSGGRALIDANQEIDLFTVDELSGGFRYVISGTVSGNPFVVNPEYAVTELTESDVNLSEFKFGATKLPSLSMYSNHALVVMSTNEIDLYRQGGDPQHKRCPTIIGPSGGDLHYPLFFTFNKISAVKLSPAYVPRVTISGFAVEMKGDQSRVNMVQCHRNNVTFESPHFYDGGCTDSVPVESFIAGSFVCGLEINTPSADKIGGDRVAHSYLVNLWACCNVKVSDPQQIGGWAQLDGNYNRDVKVVGGTIDRAGGHFACWDYTFENNTFSNSNAIKITGGGLLRVINPILSINNSFSEWLLVNIREDYAAEWNGMILVDGYTIDATSLQGETPAQRTLTIVSCLIGSGVGNHNFGRRTHLATKIVVKDGLVKLPASINGDLIVREVATGAVSAISNEMVYPKSIDIKDCDIADEGGNQKYLHVALDMFGELKPAAYLSKMRVSIDGIDNKDPRDFGENPSYSNVTPTVNVASNSLLDVLVSVNNSDWISFRANPTSNRLIDVKVDNSLIAGVDGGYRARYEFGPGCNYCGTFFSGDWKGVMNGGRIKVYKKYDNSGYGFVGYPNKIEHNLTFCRGVIVDTDGVITADQVIYSDAITVETIQTGYISQTYHFPELAVGGQ